MTTSVVRGGVDVQSALHAMVEAIGDRDGLGRIAEVFAAIDSDNNGQLSIEEFTAGLELFGAKGIVDDQEMVQAMFTALDLDKSGEISMDEFKHIAKMELEFAVLRKVLPEADEINDYTEQELKEYEQRRKLAHSSVKKGIRMQRTASVEYNPKMQGDPEMMTLAAMRDRQAIKEDTKLIELCRKWWDDREIRGDGQDADGMDKEAYTILSMALHKHLVPEISEGELLDAVDRDWAQDCPSQKEVMTFDDFYTSMFELCDTWIDGTDANAHNHLMRQFSSHHKQAELAELEKRAEAERIRLEEEAENLAAMIEMAVAVAQAAAASAATALLIGATAMEEAARRAKREGIQSKLRWEALQKTMKASKKAVEMAKAAAAAAAAAAVHGLKAGSRASKEQEFALLIIKRAAEIALAAGCCAQIASTEADEAVIMAAAMASSWIAQEAASEAAEMAAAAASEAAGVAMLSAVAMALQAAAAAEVIVGEVDRAIADARERLAAIAAASSAASEMAAAAARVAEDVTARVEATMIWLAAAVARQAAAQSTMKAEVAEAAALELTRRFALATAAKAALAAAVEAMALAVAAAKATEAQKARTAARKVAYAAAAQAVVFLAKVAAKVAAVVGAKAVATMQQAQARAADAIAAMRARKAVAMAFLASAAITTLVAEVEAIVNQAGKAAQEAALEAARNAMLAALAAVSTGEELERTMGAAKDAAGDAARVAMNAAGETMPIKADVEKALTLMASRLASSVAFAAGEAAQRAAQTAIDAAEAETKARLRAAAAKAAKEAAAAAMIAMARALEMAAEAEVVAEAAAAEAVGAMKRAAADAAFIAVQAATEARNLAASAEEVACVLAAAVSARVALAAATKAELMAADAANTAAAAAEKKERAAEAVASAAAIAGAAAWFAQSAALMADAMIESARGSKEQAIHMMYCAAMDCWQRHFVERQRWKGHRCPSCAVMTLLNKWHIREEFMQWPSHLLWLKECHCEVDGEGTGKDRSVGGKCASNEEVVRARQWADAMRGLSFVDLFGLAYRSFSAQNSRGLGGQEDATRTRQREREARRKKQEEERLKDQRPKGSGRWDVESIVPSAKAQAHGRGGIVPFGEQPHRQRQRERQQQRQAKRGTGRSKGKGQQYTLEDAMPKAHRASGRISPSADGLRGEGSGHTQAQTQQRQAHRQLQRPISYADRQVQLQQQEHRVVPNSMSGPLSRMRQSSAGDDERARIFTHGSQSRQLGGPSIEQPVQEQPVLQEEQPVLQTSHSMPARLGAEEAPMFRREQSAWSVQNGRPETVAASRGGGIGGGRGGARSPPASFLGGGASGGAATVRSASSSRKRPQTAVGHKGYGGSAWGQALYVQPSQSKTTAAEEAHRQHQQQQLQLQEYRRRQQQQERQAQRLVFPRMEGDGALGRASEGEFWEEDEDRLMLVDTGSGGVMLKYDGVDRGMAAQQLGVAQNSCSKVGEDQGGVDADAPSQDKQQHTWDRPSGSSKYQQYHPASSQYRNARQRQTQRIEQAKAPDDASDDTVARKPTIDPKLFRRTWESPAYVPKHRPSSAVGCSSTALTRPGTASMQRTRGRGAEQTQPQGRGHAALWCRRAAPQPAYSLQPGALYRHIKK
jgi:hypothetical protein